MQDYFMEAVCKTGIFILCAQVLIHFRPKAVYEKYLKMLVSAMILVQLFAPIGNLFLGTGDMDWSGQLTEFENKLQERLELTAQETDELTEEISRAEQSGKSQEERISSFSVPEINKITVGQIQTGSEEGGRQNATD